MATTEARETNDWTDRAFWLTRETTSSTVAEGRWASGRRRVFVGEARLIDADGEEAGRGTGTFMRSHIPLAGLPGYQPG